MISINISDLIWTIINFLLFCFLLNHFLFKPVLRFMDDRQARVDAKLSEKREAEALAEENDARIESEKEKSRDEAKRILSKADSDSAEQHAALMLQAREDAATPELADLLARHLLGEE